jgi:short-subunit dehydrogenase
LASTSRIVVTGASRGIGEALAREYAGRGVFLILAGRDADRLEAVAAACRSDGAEAEILVLDIRDRAGAAEALRRLDEAGPIDLLLANAGVQMPTRDEPGDLLSSYEEIETNLLGTLNTVVPLAERMAARGRGQIALISSLAAYAPLPDSPGYSGSKAGLLVWGLSLRGRLRAAGVKVSVVCPGYIDAGMGHRFKGWKLRVLPVRRTAAIIRRGLEADRAVIAFPFPLSWVARLTQLMPEWLSAMVQRMSRFRVEAQP